MNTFHRGVMALLSIALAVVVFAAGCGGGGGSHSSTQPSISGNVRNAAGSPVSGVTVVVVGGGTSTSTNTAGSFTINGLSSGDYTIRLSKSGYTTEDLLITVQAGDTMQVSAVIGSEPYVFTGAVRDYTSHVPVVGAVVTIGSKTATTDATGNFRIGFSAVPAAATWSVNGVNATPSPGYYDYWAKVGIVTTTFDARQIPMPSTSPGSNVMPTVYLWNRNSPPPAGT